MFQKLQKNHIFQQWYFLIEKGLSGYQVVENYSWSHLGTFFIMFEAMTTHGQATK